MLRLGADRLTVADLVAVAREGRAVALAPAAVEAVAAGQAAMLGLVASGAAVYGVSTGLGAAVDTAPSAGLAERQRLIPLARAVAVGRIAATEQVRAIMLARLAGLACGRSGASSGIVVVWGELLNRRLHPVVRLTGSLGEADLALLAPIAAALGGAGEVELDGELLPAAAALARAGLEVPEFGPKDGLALVSANAGSVGLAALAVADAATVLDAALGAACLSLEGFRGSVHPFDTRVAELRPAPGQAEAARRVRALLAGGALAQPGSARLLQDPLSFRVLASLHGAATQALGRATEAVELELNSSDDNPAILAEDGIALPNANFDPTHLVLALDTLGQALLRVGVAAAGRVLQLMSPGISGLPRFLAPVQDGRNGFATVQKTAAALVAEMQHAAAPMPAVVLPAADHVEDYATMAPAVAERIGALVERLRLLVGIELMVAAQACDLRGPLQMGDGTQALHDAVRARVPPLEGDRSTGPDIEALAELIRDGLLPEMA